MYLIQELEIESEIPEEAQKMKNANYLSAVACRSVRSEVVGGCKTTCLPTVEVTSCDLG